MPPSQKSISAAASSDSSAKSDAGPADVNPSSESADASRSTDASRSVEAALPGRHCGTSTDGGEEEKIPLGRNSDERQMGSCPRGSRAASNASSCNHGRAGVSGDAACGAGAACATVAAGWPGVACGAEAVTRPPPARRSKKCQARSRSGMVSRSMRPSTPTESSPGSPGALSDSSPGSLPVQGGASSASQLRGAARSANTRRRADPRGRES